MQLKFDVFFQHLPSDKNLCLRICDPSVIKTEQQVFRHCNIATFCRHFVVFYLQQLLPCCRVFTCRAIYCDS